MAVSAFLQSDFTTQDPATYKAAIDGDIQVFSRIAGAFAPHAASPAGMSVLVDAGALFVNGATVELGQQTVVIAAAPASPNNRIDRVVIDATTGAASVIAGTPASSPAAPAIASGKIPVAQVRVNNGTVAIGNSLITDERIGAGAGSGGFDPGDIKWTAKPLTVAPVGWLFCAGQQVSRATYAALFAAIGTTYGAGDGSATFNVPDLRGRTVVGLDNPGGLGTAGRMTQITNGTGNSGGADTVTLTAAQSGVGSHGHSASGSSSGSFTNYATTDAGAASGVVGSGNAGVPSSSIAVSVSTSVSVVANSANAASAHPNVQPSMILPALIKY